MKKNNIVKRFVWILIGIVTTMILTSSASAKGAFFNKVKGFFNPQSLLQQLSVITELRKEELISLKANILESLKGLGTKKDLFLSSMMLIQTDNEFAFVEDLFKSEKKTLRTWIKRELRISDEWLDKINFDYMSKGMETKISK
jgi:hypothetical protein